jgi:hypothetical protein
MSGKKKKATRESGGPGGEKMMGILSAMANALGGGWSEKIFGFRASAAPRASLHSSLLSGLLCQRRGAKDGCSLLPTCFSGNKLGGDRDGMAVASGAGLRMSCDAGFCVAGGVGSVALQLGVCRFALAPASLLTVSSEVREASTASDSCKNAWAVDGDGVGNIKKQQNSVGVDRPCLVRRSVLLYMRRFSLFTSVRHFFIFFLQAARATLPRLQHLPTSRQLISCVDQTTVPSSFAVLGGTVVSRGTRCGRKGQ